MTIEDADTLEVIADWVEEHGGPFAAELRRIAGRNIQFALAKFCSKHEMPRFNGTHRPWTFRGFTYATDGRRVMRMPSCEPDTVVVESTVALRREDGTRLPDPTSLPWPTADATGWQAWPQEMVFTEECKNCNGTRVVTCDACERETPCEECPVKLGDLQLAVGFYRDLGRLRNVRWRVEPFHAHFAIQFSFDGGEGIQMPLVPGMT